jgi:hypothetical protein
MPFYNAVPLLSRDLNAERKHKRVPICALSILVRELFLPSRRRSHTLVGSLLSLKLLAKLPSPIKVISVALTVNPRPLEHLAAVPLGMSSKMSSESPNIGNANSTLNLLALTNAPLCGPLKRKPNLLYGNYAMIRTEMPLSNLLL